MRKQPQKFDRHILQNRTQEISAREHLRIASKLEKQNLCTCRLERPEHDVYIEEDNGGDQVVVQSHRVKYGCDDTDKIRPFVVWNHGNHEINYEWMRTRQLPQRLASVFPALISDVSISLGKEISYDNVVVSCSLDFETIIVTCAQYEGTSRCPVFVFRLHHT